MEGKRKYSDALKGIRIAVLPLNYASEAKGSVELTVLQSTIMEEIIKG